MPSNPKPKVDEAENEAGNRGGETEEKRKGRPGRKKLRGRPEPEREGRRKVAATVRRDLER